MAFMWGTALGAAADSYRKQRADQRAQDEADWENEQRARQRQAQNAPIPKIGDLLPDGTAQGMTAADAAKAMDVDPAQLTAQEGQGLDKLNTFLQGHAVGSGAAPGATAIPAGAGAPAPAAAAPAPAPADVPAPAPADVPAPQTAIPAGAAEANPTTPPPPPPAAAPAPSTDTPGRWLAYQTPSGIMYTNQTRAATADDQLNARAAAYMAAGMEDKAVPLMQYVTQKKMTDLQLDQMQNQARYEKTWKDASTAAFNGDWQGVTKAINKEFSNTGATFKTSVDDQGTMRVDTVDNRTGQTIGTHMFATDPSSNPNGLPDVMGFLASMKDPATALQFRQQTAQQTYQHEMITLGNRQAANQEQATRQQGAYQTSMVGIDRQRAATEAALAQSSINRNRVEIQGLQQMQDARNKIFTNSVGSPAYNEGMAQIRAASGQGPLPMQYSPDGQSRIDPNTNAQDQRVMVGTGRDATPMWVPAPVAGNHTMMSDPYVKSNKVTPQWGVDPKTGKPAVTYVPAGATQGLPTFDAAKAAYDHAHPKDSKRALQASPASDEGSGMGVTVNPLKSGWGAISPADIGGAIGSAYTNPNPDVTYGG
jgi:hypothetical protein